MNLLVGIEIPTSLISRKPRIGHKIISTKLSSGKQFSGNDRKRLQVGSLEPGKWWRKPTTTTELTTSLQVTSMTLMVPCNYASCQKLPTDNSRCCWRAWSKWTVEMEWERLCQLQRQSRVVDDCVCCS